MVLAGGSSQIGLPVRSVPAPILKYLPIKEQPVKKNPRQNFPLPRSDMEHPTKPATTPSKGGGGGSYYSGGGGGGGGSPSVGPTPLSTSINTGGGAQYQNPLKVGFERLNTQMNQPSQILINKIIQDRQTQIRQGQTVYNQGRSFNQLAPYEQRGTSSIQQTTFSDEQLLKMPFGAGESEFLGRQSAQGKADIQKVYDKEAAQLNEEVQTRINEVTQGIQKDINDGKISLEEGQSFLDSYVKGQEKYFNVELENRAGPQANNILTSRNEEVNQQLKDSRSFWSGRGLTETAVQIVGSAPTAALMGGAAALSGGAALLVGGYGAYSLGKSGIDYATGKKSLSQLPQEAVVTASSLLIGGGAYRGIKGKTTSTTTINEPVGFIGKIVGDVGEYKIKSGTKTTFQRVKLQEGGQAEGTFFQLTPNKGALDITAGKTNSKGSKGTSGSVSELFGSLKIDEVAGEVKIPIPENANPIFSRGPVELVSKGKADPSRLGVIDLIGETDSAMILKSLINKPRQIPEAKGYSQSSFLGFVKESKEPGTFNVFGTSSGLKLRLYKSGRQSVVAPKSSFNIFGKVKVESGESKGYTSFNNFKRRSESLTVLNNEALISSLLPSIKPETRQISKKTTEVYSSPFTTNKIDSGGIATTKALTESQPLESLSFKTLIAGLNDKQESKERAVQVSKEKSSPRQRAASSFGIINLNTELPAESLGFSQVNNFISSFKQDQGQRLNQAQKMRMNELSLNQAFGFGTFRPETKTPKVSKSYPSDEEGNNKKEIGYRVEVKRKGKFVPLSNKIFSYKKAFGFGSSAVDRSTSRTFRLVDTGKFVKSEKKNYGDMGLSYKFRSPIRRGSPIGGRNVFVEKSRFSLDVERLPRKRGFFRI